MIVAASATLLAESRAGGRGAVPWALLVAGSWRAWPLTWQWRSRP